MKSIVWLEDISKNDISFAGGKGAQLGKLKKAGFDVPDGFVITTNVYNTIKNKLAKPIKNILSNMDTGNAGNLEKASKKIQTALTSISLPEVVKKDILMSYKKLGGPVAVRSSATAEDLMEASFAGQMSTFLNVTDDRLIESVKRCIASLFTARAIYYRNQKGISHTKVSVAVVVQKMVKAQKAGVAFCMNPVTNNVNEIVIEASSGLGEAVVGGQVIPDNYVVSKETDRIKVRNPVKTPVLADSEIAHLTKIIKKIEKHYGFPQDIEWAIDNKGRIFVLQARPVTTLHAVNKPVWKKILSREYAVQYTELSLKCLSPANKDVVPAAFYEQVYVPEDGNETCYVDETRWNAFVSALKTKYVEHPENYSGFENSFMKTGSGYTEASEKISRQNLKVKSNASLNRLYLDYLKKNLAYGPFIWLQFIINNFFSERAKEIIADKIGKANPELYDYIGICLKPEKKASSIQLNEIAVRWERLSTTEKSRIYEKFKWVPCLDIHNKPWTKEEFFSHVNEFKKTEKASHVTYEIMIKEINPSAKEKRTIEIAKRLAYLKDLKDDFRRQGVFYAQKMFGEIANRMGITLQDISYATEEEVVDFLENGNKIPEGVIESRKKGFAIYFTAEKKIECKAGSDAGYALNKLGLVAAEKLLEEIKGTPASPGKARGIVRLVRGVADLPKIRKGDILVAVTTHPDYVPAMQRAAAVVTDEGGITSHAAIVARELGLPCIVGTKHATKSLRDGDEVEVDANNGFVGKIKKYSRPRK